MPEIDLDNLYDAEGNKIDPDELAGPQGLREHAKRLEKELRENTEKVNELSQAARENLFYKAGVDPTNERNGYFVRGYTGDPTPEAVRAAYEEFTGDQPVSSDPQRVAAAAAGANTVPSTNAGAPKFVTNSEEYQAALAATGGDQMKVLGVMREFGSPIADIDD